jgi:hypothetical protein
VEIIGVILAGIIIGLLGEVRSSWQPGQHSAPGLVTLRAL